MNRYSIVVHNITYSKAKDYLLALQSKREIAGVYLQQKLKNIDIISLTVEELLEKLIQTKKPQIFAESDVSGDGSDWNMTELSILGDISFAVPVCVYDNGLHYKPYIYQKPFEATLLYTPGALLRNGKNKLPADWEEVTSNYQINYDAYYHLYERRLLPLFFYTQNQSKKHNKKAIITIPGLGCGQFAGIFKGQLGSVLQKVLIDLIQNHGINFSNIKAVYYDPYSSCKNERLEINGISFITRPLTVIGNENKAQLCEPYKYEEEGDNFNNCELYSIVAWDHVSWPGNDFYIGSRATDDGVKAAATNSMSVMTGINGSYNTSHFTYDPPEEFQNWEDVIMKKKIELQINNNLVIYENI